MDRLRSHFNILVESKQQPIKLSKMDFFVQNMIVRFNNSDCKFKLNFRHKWEKPRKRKKY